jgi:hypothetical protein
VAQPVESAEVFTRDADGKLTPYGQAERWTMEFAAAREKVRKWHGQAEKILDRYLDERDRATVGESRLNLFSANVDTQHAMLFGKVPGADVARRFEDPNDDVARVAAEMWERILTPLSASDPYVTALGYVLEDRLLPGFGFATARYEVETEQATDETGNPVLDEAGEPVETKARESVEVDYHYWKSVLWSPCRTFEESRWWAWCSPLTRADLVKRFGEDVGAAIPMNAKTGKKGEADAAKNDPWARAEVWEIWCKEDRTVYWYVEGFNRILDEKPDPLGLDDFYPFPKPMIARPTTRALVPRPDFLLGQDLYNEIDNLSTRIKLLEDAIRVAGVYDASSTEVARLLTDAGFNKLYPATNCAMFAEKGGLKGAVDWFPLEQVVNAIKILTEKRAEKIGLLQQVTGWSDIMRGQSNASETLGAQQMKAQYGSVRIEKFRNEFARYATDLQRIRAEIIAKHFDPKTIIERSNVLHTPDAAMAEQAAQLIKDKLSAYRIEVKPESINLTDYATLRQERAEVVTALGGLVAATAPLIQAAGPLAADFVLAAGAWLLAGIKGGDSLEAEFDQFRAKLQKQAEQAAMQPPPPDPKLEAAKAQAAAKIEGAKIDMAGKQMDMQVKAAEHRMDMAKLGAEVQANQANAQTEIAKARAMPMPMPGMEGK